MQPAFVFGSEAAHLALEISDIRTAYGMKVQAASSRQDFSIAQTALCAAERPSVTKIFKLVEKVVISMHLMNRSFTAAKRIVSRSSATCEARCKINVRDGLTGEPDIRVTADSKVWLGYLAKEKSLAWALIGRKIRISGNPKLLLAFGKCFPSPSIKHKHVEVLPETSLLRPSIKPYEKNDRITGKVRWHGELALKEVLQVSHNVKTFRFVDPRGGEIPFRHVAGQFLTLDIAPHGIPTRRSYTIASPPNWRDRIEITVKREEHGLVSRWLLDELQPGDRIKVEAPSGTFVFSGKEAPSVVLIAGGVGITPMMSLTDLELRAAKPRDSLFKLSDGDGRQLWVYPDGARR
ncbi:FAD-binding oxidoreductase [Methylosinus sporium]|uniref:FAD-binding oxidoreductase n=1 Tax=Methylosinus sporium TaxID=428 RepID=UPI00383A61AF